MKVLHITTPDGLYRLPLIEVAKDRAAYYSVEGTEEYQQEIDFIMNDPEEGIDWILNNSDYQDWEDKTEKIDDFETCPKDDFWTTTDHFKVAELIP